MVGGHRGPRRDRIARTRGLGALAGAAAIGYRACSSHCTPDPARGAQEDFMIKRLISDRKSVVQGQSVSVRVDLGGRRIIKQKKTDPGVRKESIINMKKMY